MFAFFSVLKQHVHWYFTQSIRKVFSNNKCRRKLLFRQRSMAGIKVLSQGFHHPSSAEKQTLISEVRVRITVHRQRLPQNTLLVIEKRKDN